MARLRRAMVAASIAWALVVALSFAVSAAAPRLVDGEFDAAANSADLRANGAGQDWYESQGDLPEILTLSANAVGGNASPKAAFAASVSGDAYLSQEFSDPLTGTFSVEWDIFLGSVVDVAGPDRAAWMLIGDAEDPTHPGPNSDDAERFVVLAFAKPGGGSAGQADLVARDRYDEWSAFTPVATGLSLQQWYTVKVVCDLDADVYEVYVDGAYAATIPSRHPKDGVSHISFAQRSDGAGAFYIDNVYETTVLQDIDSGLTSPTGSYRWRDIADQLYASSYRTTYDYTQARVDVRYDRSGSSFQGTLHAYNLKPNFAYQLKLAGTPGTEANERIGLAGRWWQEEWNGVEWSDGQNLNDKGDGSSPSPNDALYFARSPITDTTSDTGFRYKYAGYLVLGYFVTDENGGAVVPFEADSSYHVLWKATQRARTDDDGPATSHTFDADPASSPAYASNYGEQTIVVFGEWERLPVGGVHLDPGEYRGQLIITEESFHGSGGSYAGNWAAAMGAGVAFQIGSPPTATVAAFSAAPRTGVRPLTVTFSNDSYGGYEASLWSFGDGVTSAVQHPLHVYESAGAFTVSLSASGSGGTDGLTRTHYITVYEPASASFTGGPLTGTAPLTVAFANGSTGDYEASLWSFGDGCTSTLENPVHVFSGPGAFTVSLTASGPGGSSTLARTNYISAYAWTISGSARFWHGAQGVPGVLLALDGTRAYSVTSAGSGAYDVGSVLGGAYTLVPSKSDDVNGIASYDASLVLQHSEGIISLASRQVTAADVNEDATVDNTDALQVLQVAVGTLAPPFPGAGAVWVFDPPSRSYADVQWDHVDQDFTAILLGDVSGDWVAPADQGARLHPAAKKENQALSATLSLPASSVLPGELITVPLNLTLPEGGVLGVDITLIFDQGVVSPTAVVEGHLASGWSMATNLGYPGELRVALAGATPIVQSGELLLVVLQAVGAGGTGTDLTFTRGDLNEGQIPAALDHGHVAVAIPVLAGFSGWPASGVAPLMVTFTNSSSGDYSASRWAFGDGVTSTLDSPSHSYSTPGAYTVTLSVDGPGGTDTLTRTGYITAHQPVSAGFSANPTSGPAPLQVTFTNESSGDFSSSLWAFGDGLTSTAEHPVHTYTSAGTYTVSATVSGPGGEDTLTRVDLITVNEPVSADFAASPLAGIAPLAVTFTNQTPGEYDTSLWTFGDGTSSAIEHPVHVYSTTGVYTVSLSVSGPGGSDTLTRSHYITAYACTVSGGTYYWNGGDGVPRTLLSLKGTRTYSTTSGESGVFEIGGVLGGDYTLTASKDDDTEGISPFDASFALRHAAGVITLTEHQATAADVNRSGVISSLDASYILQRSVGLIELPFPGAAAVWAFDPASRTYTDLDTDQADQAFTAVLLGDVSGNWSVNGAAGASARPDSQADEVTATLSLPHAIGRPGHPLTVSMILDLPHGEALGLGLTMAFDPTVISPTHVLVGSLAQTWSVAANLVDPGEVKVAMAGATPVTNGGELLRFVFTVIGPSGSETALELTDGQLNEGAIPLQLVSGRVGIYQVHLPLILASSAAQGDGRARLASYSLRWMGRSAPRPAGS